jgi:hypothetical protein
MTNSYAAEGRKGPCVTQDKSKVHAGQRKAVRTFYFNVN